MRYHDQLWDPGLQNERTKLSWQRTLLSMLACALVVARLVGTYAWQWGLLVAVIASAGGLWASFRVRMRYRSSQMALYEERALPDGLANVALTVGVLVVGVAAMGYVLATWL